MKGPWRKDTPLFEKSCWHNFTLVVASEDDPAKLKSVLDVLSSWAERTGGQVYFPIHPRTKGNMERFGLNLPARVIDPGPLGYIDMQAALFHSDRVLTDSGGVQKEAWFQGTSAVILRSTTEWRELIELGSSELFDPEKLKASEGASELLERLAFDRTVPNVVGSGLFGEGQAAPRVLSALETFLT